MSLENSCYTLVHSVFNVTCL